jgi:S-DNA-T family DNA segregation ATPase FtsK/SpoIIIE
MQMRRTRFLPKVLAVELRRLPWRAAGFSLFAAAGACWAALLSWSFVDPSPNYATLTEPRNWLGYRGANVADFLMEGFGLAAPLIVLPLAAFGLQIATGYSPLRPRLRLVFWTAALLAVPAFFSFLAVSPRWLLGTGLGGIAGDAVAGRIAKLLPAIPAAVLWPVSALLFLILGSWLLARACGLKASDLWLAFQSASGASQNPSSFPEPFTAPRDGERLANKVTSWTKFLSRRDRALVPVAPREFWMTETRAEPSLSPAPPAGKPSPNEAAAANGTQGSRPARFAAWGAPSPSEAAGAAGDLAAFQTAARTEQQGGGQKSGEGEPPFDDVRVEPFFGPRRDANPYGESGGGSDRERPATGFRRLTARTAEAAGNGAQRLFDNVASGIRNRKTLIVQRETAAPSSGPREEPHSAFAPALPPLSLLAPAPPAPYRRDAADPLAMQRAASLMNVLGDFGVKGRISGIYPGPVITLFELEPARGTKSSRVAGLAEDIARSMSAVSARIAVVPGRDAIGIELPNPKRETVALRAILESPAFRNSQGALPLALGKSIGGEPITVDLARMPHLLIAGTTGSGKSVGINAMILSLLFRLPPAQCNFIMIDPKMLELSVYRGIPHLIAPVVTDPKKAVTALKWAVKEMNARYERMSKLGVRNVAGYNAKCAAAQLRGQPLRRAVQTGFDPRSERPVEEEEIFDPEPMPYLIVVIDEMADLMMTAGKDVEFAVQRLSQMARAAGIHLIMATQRPSVDVVTGTIKANFPSRISFQVTSKIDSRTIIGEQGAEQLLGAGDMLYMAAGGRIIRAHGPFVSDEEVDAVVSYLKAQGVPSYRDDILEDLEGQDDNPLPATMNGGGGSGLYEQAVQIVLKDRKPSASNLQKRLGIGHNRAAELIHRMEQEGIIGAPGRAGRREILFDAGP